MHVQSVQNYCFSLSNANLWGFCCRRRRVFKLAITEGEEQNREEGEMAQKSWEQGEIGRKCEVNG